MAKNVKRGFITTGIFPIIIPLSSQNLCSCHLCPHADVEMQDVSTSTAEPTDVGPSAVQKTESDVVIVELQAGRGKR